MQMKFKFNVIGLKYFVQKHLCEPFEADVELTFDGGAGVCKEIFVRVCPQESPATLFSFQGKN